VLLLKLVAIVCMTKLAVDSQPHTDDSAPKPTLSRVEKRMLTFTRDNDVGGLNDVRFGKVVKKMSCPVKLRSTSTWLEHHVQLHADISIQSIKSVNREEKGA